MANNNSTTIANREATPPEVANADTLYGKKRVLVETIEIDAADNDGDTYAMLPVMLDYRIDDIKVLNDAITGGTDLDIGLYAVKDGTLGAVVDADIYADGISVATARNVATSVLGSGAGSRDKANSKNRVWADAGYADVSAGRDATENNELYLVVTANTVGTASGTLVVQVEVTVE
jgi:hypothetical protein